ncbi:MAG: glycosyltransferase [Phycisphaerales bacterium]
MRILHISTRLILGGSQENTVLSCEGQASSGHEVHLAFGPIYGPEGSLLKRVESFRSPGSVGRAITSHVVPDLVRAIHPLRDWRARRQLGTLIERLRPDVVHTHSSKAGVLGRAAAWSARPRPAVVHTIHGPPFFDGQNPLIHRLYVLSERYAARRCHMIVSVADAMTRQYLAHGIGGPEQYVTVRSGMESERFLVPAPGEDRATIRAALGFSDGHLVIGTVARLADQKGHDDILDALGEPLRSPERAHYRLLWVGDGWRRERLLARVRTLGIGVRELDRPGPHDQEARVVLTGLVPPERVAGLVRAMDMLVHPSSREGLPRTVPQALLCGVCPVAYDCDGTGEACIDGVTGLLVPTHDRAGLGRAVLQLAADPARRARLAEEGRRRCAEAFGAGRMVENLASVYARAIELNSAGA